MFTDISVLFLCLAVGLFGLGAGYYLAASIFRPRR